MQYLRHKQKNLFVAIWNSNLIRCLVFYLNKRATLPLGISLWDFLCLEQQVEIMLPRGGGLIPSLWRSNAFPLVSLLAWLLSTPGEYEAEEKPAALFHTEVTFCTTVGGWYALVLPTLPLFWGGVGGAHSWRRTIFMHLILVVIIKNYHSTNN